MQYTFRLRAARYGLSFGCALVFAVCAMACQRDLAAPTFQDDRDLYWRLELNHHAVTLGLVSPYDTVHLMATPRTVTGAALPSTAIVRYTVRDTSVVIDANGVLHARFPIRRLVVTASLTVGSMTLRDSVLVTVNAVTSNPPSRVTTFSIHPDVGEQLTGSCLPEDGTKQLTPTVRDADGRSIVDSVAVMYRSSNTDTVRVDPFAGAIAPACAPGSSSWLYATATVYGISHTDSIRYVVTPSSRASVGTGIRNNLMTGRPEVFFYPDTVTVPAGGAVMWQNVTFLPLDVVFDTPAAAVDIGNPIIYSFFGGPIMPSGGGNIMAFTTDSATIPFARADGRNLRARRFMTPGTYAYHSQLYSTRGVIVIVPKVP